MEMKYLLGEGLERGSGGLGREPRRGSGRRSGKGLEIGSIEEKKED